MSSEWELAAQERAALIAYHLPRGEGLTVWQVCALTGLTRSLHFAQARLLTPLGVIISLRPDRRTS